MLKRLVHGKELNTSADAYTVNVSPASIPMQPAQPARRPSTRAAAGRRVLRVRTSAASMMSTASASTNSATSAQSTCKS